MSLGKILVALNGATQDEVLLTTAVRAAKLFNAHVAVAFAHENPGEAASSMGVPLSAEAMSAIFDANVQIFRAMAERIRNTMTRVAASEGAIVVETPHRAAKVTLSFHESIGYPPEVIGNLAGLADLTVCGPARNSTTAFETDIDLILQHRRPVLVTSSVPAVFHKVAIGWNNTPAAARAISAAMPFLEKAKSVQLLCLEKATTEQFGTRAVAAYLNAHGIEPRELHLGSYDTASKDEISNLARGGGADLLVIGAFGHSRVSETIFGGVTNETLRRPFLPVLLAH